MMAKYAPKTIAIKPTETAPAEIIADSIKSISEGVHKLRSGRLNDRALLVLLHHATGIGQREIKVVLDALESLEGHYLKKKPA